MNGQVNQVIALFGNELAADTLTFVVNSKALVGDGTGYAFLLDSDMKPLKTSDGKFLVVRQIYTDWRDFTPGAPLDLYNNPNGTMIGRFYVEEVTQVNRKAVRFTCTDCVGIMAGMDDHGGGVYTGETVSQICAEIFAGSGLTYAVSEDVGAVQCYGRLPRDNRRTNLGRLLVATGATLMEKNGVVQIVYLGTGTTSTMYQRNIYLRNGEVVQKDPATAVTVTEHAFYKLASDKVETLFDNTSEVTPAEDQLVIFSEACHDLAATGTLTISESNANYAIVSGVGTLTGSVYTHTRRQITKDTGVTTYKEHVEAIEDNELIGLHNSEYVAQRMANYYAIRTSIEFDALDPAGNLLPGSPVNFTDPFGTARTGWIHKKDYAIGNKTRAKWEIPVDWTPGPWGSNLDACELFDEAGTFTWTVPEGVTSLTVQLVGGGQAGFDGENGKSGSAGSSDQFSGTGKGGDGGAKGLGGHPGKANAVTVTVTPGQTVTITIGIGGQRRHRYDHHDQRNDLYQRRRCDPGRRHHEHMDRRDLRAGRSGRRRRSQGRRQTALWRRPGRVERRKPWPRLYVQVQFYIRNGNRRRRRRRSSWPQWLDRWRRRSVVPEVEQQHLPLYNRIRRRRCPGSGCGNRPV